MSDVTRVLSQIESGDPSSAAESMRRIIVEGIRRQRRLNRGGPNPLVNALYGVETT